MAVRVEGRDIVEADAVVGADGINSPVASLLNGGLRFAYSGYTAWRGIAETEFEPDRDQLRACLAGGHEFGWMPPVAGGFIGSRLLGCLNITIRPRATRRVWPKCSPDGPGPSQTSSHRHVPTGWCATISSIGFPLGGGAMAPSPSLETPLTR